ncbi:hypothetical protein ACLIKE_08880 [Ferroplasma acidiphilum]|uniref:Uncharacterized protein n=1 Tax=Ferroplasma acidiphilum TaxID=74969 RepID=A0A7K4FP56_9ARCH|nr:hypothetical protein [Ferroplasma acidiphilum]NOL60796.1 hypothetical protein [Ferroplasma acidiphilum]
MAYLNIENELFIERHDKGTRLSSPNFEDVMLRTKVRSYAQAPAHLLAVAERIRDYIAFNFQNTVPLNISMSGKRKYTGQFPFGIVIYDGATLKPMTDGGRGERSFFVTRFGKPEGGSIPTSAFESLDNFTKYVQQVNKKLKNSQTMLNKIKPNSPLDVALNALGESIWAKLPKDKLTSNWRAVEAICKFDNPGKIISSSMILPTIKKYANIEMSDSQFEKVRKDRNKCIHWNPSFEDSISIENSANLLFQISVEITNAIIKKRGIL